MEFLRDHPALTTTPPLRGTPPKEGNKKAAPQSFSIKRGAGVASVASKRTRWVINNPTDLLVGANRPWRA